MNTNRLNILGLQIMTIILIGIVFLISSTMQTVYAQSYLVPELKNTYLGVSVPISISTSTIEVTTKETPPLKTGTASNDPFGFLSQIATAFITVVRNMP